MGVGTQTSCYAGTFLQFRNRAIYFLIGSSQAILICLRSNPPNLVSSVLYFLRMDSAGNILYICIAAGVALCVIMIGVSAVLLCIADNAAILHSLFTKLPD